jgi:hypothetical protein
MRCERKVPIELCEWDGGFLVCTVYGCKDGSINGALEYAWAQEAARDRQELVPDPKLIRPTDVNLQIRQVAASAGKF